MKPFDFFLLMTCCTMWGLSLPLTGWIVSDVPPIFTAGLRFLGLALLLFPFLKPVPKQMGLVFLIATCIGGMHFLLLFLGLKVAPASAVAIVGQLSLPIVTALSIVFLNEKVGWRRGLGMTLAFIGVLSVLYQPGKFSFEIGLVFVATAALVGAIGTILMKQVKPLPALNLQAWVGLFSFAPLFVLSAFTETRQFEHLLAAGPATWVGIVFSITIVSIFGHSVYYQLLKRYDVTLLAPLTLITPLIAVLIGVFVLHEPFSLKLAIGGAITLAGVFLVARPENTSLIQDAVAHANKG